MPATIRLLLVDDHPVVRAGLVAMLGCEPGLTVAGQTGDGREALALFAELRPDVTLLDLQMPGADGLTVLAAIRAQAPAAPVVILTAFDGDEDVHRAMRAGAQAYLLKDAPREQLVECIRTVHAGRSYLPAALAGKLAARVRGPDLSPRELEVLALVAAGRSNKEIGARLFVSEGTIKTHVKSILAKLDVISRAEAVASALRRGFLKK